MTTVDFVEKSVDDDVRYRQDGAPDEIIKHRVVSFFVLLRKEMCRSDACSQFEEQLENHNFPSRLLGRLDVRDEDYYDDEGYPGESEWETFTYDDIVNDSPMSDLSPAAVAAKIVNGALSSIDDYGFADEVFVAGVRSGLMEIDFLPPVESTTVELAYGTDASLRGRNHVKVRLTVDQMRALGFEELWCGCCFPRDRHSEEMARRIADHLPDLKGAPPWGRWVGITVPRQTCRLPTTWSHGRQW